MQIGRLEFKVGGVRGGRDVVCLFRRSSSGVPRVEKRDLSTVFDREDLLLWSRNPPY